jgi:hypothetical protein
MTPLNPLTAAVLQSQSLQRAQSTSKNDQIRKSHVLARNVAATADTFEHTVESTDRVDPSHDQDAKKDSQQQGKRKKKPGAADGQAPHVDVTA